MAGRKASVREIRLTCITNVSQRLVIVIICLSIKIRYLESLKEQSLRDTGLFIPSNTKINKDTVRLVYN
jgi:hypothetical protein